MWFDEPVLMFEDVLVIINFIFGYPINGNKNRYIYCRNQYPA